MSESDAVVERVDGNHLWLRPLGAGSGCGSCTQKTACGMRSVEGHGQSPLICLPNSIQARAGDTVVIHAAEGVLLRAVWRVYGVPLIAGLAGAMIALTITGSDGVALVGLLLGLAGGFLSLLRTRNATTGQRAALSVFFKSPS